MGLLARRFAVTFVPFHRFSPFIKTLRITRLARLSLRVFNLVISFLLLEDLTVVAGSEVMLHGSSFDGLPSLSIFTGSLEVFDKTYQSSIAVSVEWHRLLEACFEEGHPQFIMELIMKCSDILEGLCIACKFCGTSIRHARPHSHH